MRPKTLVLSLAIFGSTALQSLPVMAQDASYPFPSYPIITQSYLNRSTPLMFAYVDNSATMKSAIYVRDGNNRYIHNKNPYKPYAPNRLDLVKNSLYRLADDYYYDFRWVLYSIKDNSYDTNWEPFSSSDLGFVDGVKPIWEYDSRYAFLKGLPLQAQKAFVKNKGQSNKGSKPVGPNGSFLPYVKYQGLDKSTGWTQKLNFKNKLYTGWPQTDQYYNNRSAQLTAGHPMRYAPLPSNVPQQRIEKTKLLNAIKSISIVDGTAFMEDSFPQMLNANRNGLNNNSDQKAYVTFNNSVRDMRSVADFVEYRCQDIFALVFADGNRVGIAKNYLAAKEGAIYHPMANYDKDLEGKYYNGPDFPNQYIYTGGIGLDKATNKAAYERFAQNGAGAGKKPLYLVSEDSDEVAEFIDDFVESNRPRSFFSASAPASVSSLTTDGKNTNRLVINLQIEANRWVSYLKMNLVNDQSQIINNNVKAIYSPTTHTIIGQSPKTKGWINLTANSSSPSLMSQHFNNQSLGIVGGVNQYQLYMPWFLTTTASDKTTGYRSRSLVDITVPGARTKEGANEFRYTGGGLNTNLLQTGERNTKLNLLEYLVYGSNDGMLKVYTATNDATQPYRYSLGLIPGNMMQTKDFSLYQAIYKRAEPDFGKSDLNPHVYGINGGISTRLTNNGQNFGVSALGQGGRGIFAFNLGGIDETTQELTGLSAKRSEWANSIPLWTSDDSANIKTDMGYVTGSPIIAAISLYRGRDNIPTYTDVFQAVFSSHGQANTANDNRISVINALNKNFGEKQTVTYDAGQLIQQIRIDGEKNTNKNNKTIFNGFSSPTVVDLDLDGIADVAYVGTRSGDIYRLDMRYPTPNEWTLIKIFSGSPDLPISLAPTMGRTVKDGKNLNTRMVVFATGATLYGQDIFNETPQKIVAFEDDLSRNPTVVTYADLRQNTSTETERGNIQGVNSTVWIRDVKVDTKKSPLEYKGWSLTLPTQFSGKTFKGKEQGNIGLTVIGQSLFLSTNSLKVDSFAAPKNEDDKNKPKPVVCFKDLTTKGGSVMALNLRDGGLPSKKDVHLLSQSKNSKKIVAGYVTTDITSPLLVSSNSKNYVTNNDGVYNLYNELTTKNTSKVLPHTIRGNPIFSKINAGENRQYITQEVACKDQNFNLAVSVGSQSLSIGLNQDCSQQHILSRLSWKEII